MNRLGRLVCLIRERERERDVVGRVRVEMRYEYDVLN